MFATEKLAISKPGIDTSEKRRGTEAFTLLLASKAKVKALALETRRRITMQILVRCTPQDRTTMFRHASDANKGG